MKACIFPGSFNPIHKGHESIINKGLLVFDKVYIVVANNSEKEESDLNARFEAVKNIFFNNPHVEVLKLEKGLLTDLARELGVKHIIRSARDGKDFEYELMLAKGYKTLDKNIEIVLIMPDEINLKLRSSIFPKEGK